MAATRGDVPIVHAMASLAHPAEMVSASAVIGGVAMLELYQSSIFNRYKMYHTFAVQR